VSAIPRLLVVDDSATARRWLERALPSYEVHLAADGREAVERAPVLRPDLILLDVVMPRLDGIAACRVLRAHPVTAATPIILVTSQDSEHSVETAYRSGATDYITKPVDTAELLAKVESWLAVAAAAGLTSP